MIITLSRSPLFALYATDRSRPGRAGRDSPSLCFRLSVPNLLSRTSRPYSAMFEGASRYQRSFCSLHFRQSIVSGGTSDSSLVFKLPSSKRMRFSHFQRTDGTISPSFSKNATADPDFLCTLVIHITEAREVNTQCLQVSANKS